MSISTIPYRVFVGVDIAAKSATVTWQGDNLPLTPPRTIAQTPEGFIALRQALLATGAPPHEILLVMEATGAYWLALATFLTHHGFVVSVINAAQAHYFAKALLKRAKTDAIDARTLSQLALLLRPTPWSPPPTLYHELHQRLSQRDSLLVLRTQLVNQRHALDLHPVVVPTVHQRLEMLIETLSQQVALIEAELRSLLSQPLGQENGWAASIERLQTIPGVGLITASWLVVSTLNFTICATAEQAASYAGLAPMPRQSGSSLNQRPCIGHSGHRRLRTALYLATLTAARFNPPLKAFYERLREKGKPSKVARCAVARKLLHLAWAIGRGSQPFLPSYGVPET